MIQAINPTWEGLAAEWGKPAVMTEQMPQAPKGLGHDKTVAYRVRLAHQETVIYQVLFLTGVVS